MNLPFPSRELNTKGASRWQPGKFGITDLERACPGVSRDLIRLRLRDLKAAGRIECLGRGPGAKWRKSGIMPLTNNRIWRVCTATIYAQENLTE